MIKLYTNKEYSAMAVKANTEGKKLIKAQEERMFPYEVSEYEKKIIQIPIYGDDGEIIGYEDKEVDDLDKPVMVEETDPESGEVVLLHKHHTEYSTDIVEYLQIIAPSEEEKKERLNKLSLTKREVFLALYKDKGITPEQLKAQITTPEALIEFEYANEYFRGNPLIDLIGQALGYTSEQLDYLFENKEIPNDSVV